MNNIVPQIVWNKAKNDDDSVTYGQFCETRKGQNSAKLSRNPFLGPGFRAPVSVVRVAAAVGVELTAAAVNSTFRGQHRALYGTHMWPVTKRPPNIGAL